MKFKRRIVVICTLIMLLVMGCFTVETSATEYPTSSITFQQEGGNYSIAYILKNFNHFILNDATAGHTIGPIAIGGKAKYINGNGNEVYNHPVSSFLKGKIDFIIQDGFFKTLYLGQANESNTFNSQARVPTFYNDNYLDFNAAFNSIKNEMTNYQGEITITNEMLNQATLISWEESYISENNGWKLTNDSNAYSPKLRLVVDAGKSYNFEDGVIKRLTRIDVMYGEQDSLNKDTLFISKDSGDVTLPYVYINGDSNYLNNLGNNTHEWGDALSITTMLPNATNVTDIDSNQVHIGHVVAPNAKISGMNGDSNGCFIAESLDVEGTESHMWPYNGVLLVDDDFLVDDEVKVNINLKAEKLMDNNVPNDIFQFKAKLIEQPNDFNISYESTVSNNGKDITFKQLKDINIVGDYKFELVEINTTDPNIEYDDNIYYIKVNVIKESNTYKIKTITYYQGNTEIDKIVFKNKTHEENPGGGEPTNPGGGEPIDPGGGEPTNPGGGEPTNPGGGEPTNPGGGEPTNPGGGEPTNPGGGEPTNPGGGEPTNPGGGEPTNPGGGEPTNPGGGEPTNPGGEAPDSNGPEVAGNENLDAKDNGTNDILDKDLNADKTVVTGDETSLFIYLISLLGALLGIFFVIKTKLNTKSY